MTPQRRSTKRATDAGTDRGLTNGEYAALVVILGAALVATALFVSWLAEQRGIIAPGSTPGPVTEWLDRLDGDDHQGDELLDDLGADDGTPGG